MNQHWIKTGTTAPLRLVGKEFDNTSAFGYAVPVAAKSATGFSGLNVKGGYRHQSDLDGFFVSTAWLASGRSCGEPSGSPVSFYAGPLTRTVALFAFSGANRALNNPSKRRKAMQNAHLRLVKGHQPPMTAEALIEQAQKNSTGEPSSFEELLLFLPEALTGVLEASLMDFDYHANLTSNHAIGCRMLAATIHAYTYRLQQEVF